MIFIKLCSHIEFSLMDPLPIESMSIQADEIPCIDGLENTILNSKDPDEEIFFNNTLKTLGDIVQDDVKLGTIFTFLVILSPSPDSIVEIREHPSILIAQNNFQLLLFRYLHNKYEGNPTKADEDYNMLLR